MKKFLEGVGIRLKDARERMGISQGELAKRVNSNTGENFQRNTFSNYENEVSSPSLSILYEIAKILEVSTDYILGGNRTKKSQFETYTFRNKKVDKIVHPICPPNVHPMEKSQFETYPFSELPLEEKNKLLIIELDRKHRKIIELYEEITQLQGENKGLLKAIEAFGKGQKNPSTDGSKTA